MSKKVTEVSTIFKVSLLSNICLGFKFYELFHSKNSKEVVEKIVPEVLLPSKNYSESI